MWRGLVSAQLYGAIIRTLCVLPTRTLACQTGNSWKSPNLFFNLISKLFQIWTQSFDLKMWHRCENCSVTSCQIVIHYSVIIKFNSSKWEFISFSTVLIKCTNSKLIFNKLQQTFNKPIKSHIYIHFIQPFIYLFINKQSLISSNVSFTHPCFFNVARTHLASSIFTFKFLPNNHFEILCMIRQVKPLLINCYFSQ